MTLSIDDEAFYERTKIRKQATSVRGDFPNNTRMSTNVRCLFRNGGKAPSGSGELDVTSEVSALVLGISSTGLLMVLFSMSTDSGRPWKEFAAGSVTAASALTAAGSIRQRMAYFLSIIISLPIRSSPVALIPKMNGPLYPKRSYNAPPTAGPVTSLLATCENGKLYHLE